MKLFCGITIVLILLLTMMVPKLGYSDETSIEDANRGTAVNAHSNFGNGIFSGLGSLQAGVNLFSGDLSISLPLFNLPGRNGFNTNISLVYSSNTHLLMNSDNKYFQTSWIGAGWDFGFGSILADLNGTKSLTDDVYYLLPQGGSGIEIIKDSDGTYQLENNPYWKVEATTSLGKIVGWTLTDLNGTIYKYGGFVNGFGNNNANRCIRHWNNWVGNGVSDGEAPICYQWDLSEIVDVTGENKTQIFYFQEQDLPLVYPADPTPTYYTRASYIDYIIDTMGRKINFVLGFRTNDEYFKKNPSFQVDQYQTRFLDKIEVFESESSVSAYMTLDIINDQLIGTGNKTKRLLTEIIQFDSEFNSLPGYKFEYAGAAEDNHGALKKITYPDGGSKTIKYKTQNNPYFDQENDQIVQGAGTSQQDEIIFKYSGTTSAYFDKTNDKLFILKWSGKWVSQSFDLSDINDDTRIAVSDNHVALFRKGSTTRLDVYNWDKNLNSWSSEFILSYTPVRRCDVAINESVLALYEEDNPAYVSTWKWEHIKREWNSSGSCTITQFGSDDWPAFLQVTDNSILVSQPTKNKRVVYVWNGTNWNLSDYADYSNDNWLSHSLKDEYFADYDQYTGKLYRYYFDGNSKIYHGVTDYSRGGYPAGRYSYPVFSQNHILICEFSGGPPDPWPFIAKIYIWDRTQSGWSSSHSLLKTIVLAQDLSEYSDYDFTINCSINDEFIAVIKRTQRKGNLTTEGPIWSWQWDAESQTWIEKSVPNSNYPRSPDTDVELAEVDFAVLGSHIVVHSPGRENVQGYPDLNGFTDVWNWNGDSWVGPSRIFNSHTYALANRYELFGGYNYVGAYRVKTGTIKARVVHGLNDWANDVVDYPVEYTSENDGFISEAIKTMYEFNPYEAVDEVSFDPFFNIAGYGEIRIIPEGDYGHIEQKFNEEITGDIRDRGLPIEIKNYKEGTTSNPLTTETKTWGIYEHTGNAYQVRLLAENITTEGVNNSVNYIYNNANGLPEKITEEGDIVDRIKEDSYAFQQPAYNGYGGMDDKNMLSQTYSTTISKDENSTIEYKAKNWTTWSNSGGYWHPDKNYAWVGNGAPPVDPRIGTDLEVGHFLSFDDFGNIKEIEDANLTITTTKWGYNSTLPIATIVNAMNSQSNVTIFDDNDDSDWTGAYGTWIIQDGVYKQTDGVTTSPWWDPRVNNESSIDDAILEADIRFDNAGNYRYTALMKYVDSNNWIRIELRKTNALVRIHTKKNGTEMYVDTAKSFNENQWYHLRGEIQGDVAKLYVDGELQLTFDNNNVDIASGKIGLCTYGTKASFDNVRFYPFDALITSQSYDPLTLQLNQQSNTTGTLSFFEYDNFNRLARTINHEQKIISENSQYYSRDGHGGVFDNTDPNFVQTATFPNGMSKDDLAGYWRLEGDGSDASGYENHGVVNGATNEHGYIGRALKFDGNDQISVNDDPTLRLGTSMSIGVWFKSAGGHGDWVRIVGKGNPTYRNYGLWVSTTGYLLFQIYSSGGNGNLSSTGINIYDDKWHHIVATYDGSYMRLYIDGIENNSLNYNKTPRTSGDALTMGFAGFHTYLKGEIDEVLIYNRVLTTEEINSLATPLIATSYTDGLGRQLQTQTRNGENDNTGNLKHQDYKHNNLANQSFDFDYDDLHRINQFKYNSSPIRSYDYDPNGNLTTFTGKTLSYDNDNNQLTGDGARTFTYDAAGRVDQIGSTMIFHDLRSNMTNYGTDSYAYDAFNQRIRKTENSNSTYYITSGPRVLAEYISDTEPAAEYIHGPSGMLAKFDPSQGHLFFYTDHLGSTRQMSSSDMRRDYYPYGENYIAAGNDETAYQFTGKELDNGIGLHYFGARYYDSSIGRWLVPDPAGQSFSPYSYAGNSPLVYVDPDGRFFGAIGDFLEKFIVKPFVSINRGFWDGMQYSNHPGFSVPLNGGPNITDLGPNFGPTNIPFASNKFMDDDPIFVPHPPVPGQISTLTPGLLVTARRPRGPNYFSWGHIYRRMSVEYKILRMYGLLGLRLHKELNAVDFELAKNIALAAAYVPSVAIGLGAYGGATLSGVRSVAPKVASKAISFGNNAIYRAKLIGETGTQFYIQNYTTINDIYKVATSIFLETAGKPGLNSSTRYGQAYEGVGLVIKAYWEDIRKQRGY